MIKNLKKAFTIIELVIVIAVIAILAAVMIPTYSSLVEKANQSADIQAVKQMNTILVAEESSGENFNSLDVVKVVLKESGINAENYKALSDEHKIIWDKDVNRILYINTSTNEVVFPEEFKDRDYLNDTWLTLEGKMDGDESWNNSIPYTESTYTIDDVAINLNSDVTYEKYTISSAAQLINLANQLNNKSNSDEDSKVNQNTIAENYIIELESKEYDMLGAEWEPIMNFAGIFNGNGATIKNLSMTSDELEGESFISCTNNTYRAFGFLSTFTGKYFGNVTLEVNYNCPGKSSSSTNHTVAGAIGAVYANEGETVVVDNVKVEGSIINEKRVGGVIGFIGGTSANLMKGTVIVQNCINEAKVESISLIDSYSTAGGIVSTSNQVSNNGKVIIRGCANKGNVKGFISAGILANSFVGGTKDNLQKNAKYYIYDNLNEGNIYCNCSGNVNHNEIDCSFAAGIYTNFNTTDKKEFYVFNNVYDKGNVISEGSCGDKHIIDKNVATKPNVASNIIKTAQPEDFSVNNGSYTYKYYNAQ